MRAAQFKLQQGNQQFYFPFFNPPSLSNKTPKLCRNHTLILPMATQSGSTKRPTCPSCSKPARICLCNRLRCPILHNSVAVTILQHNLEKKHPLNSTRIATIGLENVRVFTVSDVNFLARFFIRLLGSCGEDDGVELDEGCHLFDEMQRREKNDEFLETSWTDSKDLEIIERSDFNGNEKSQLCQSVTNLKGSEVAAINFTIAKYGASTSFNSNCKMGANKNQEMSFHHLLADEELRKGFIVKKLGVKQLKEINEYEESEEFEIAVPPGSVLLFPSESSVDIESLNFKVKNLIVLDGTWAKAKRMYNENPWLKLLPHIRLDIDKLSLYSEVRHQPRAGYLSTIESIVYAMKAVGEDCDGLDCLLEVFESMVGDQRRCKNERLSIATEE